MACSLPHTDYEVEALVQKLIDEDKVRQNAILDLACNLKIHAQLKTILEKLTRNAAKLEKQMDAKLAWLLEKYYYRSQTHIEKAMDEKAREKKIKQKQAEDDEFFLEFGAVRYDSEYESSD
ncbi:hypothetical protein Tco_1480582 [Tanacetum coccineum]